MQWCTYVKYPKWCTESRSSLLIRVNGSYNVVELLANSIYGVFSVVVCTPFCEIGSMGSFPIRHPKYVTLADVVIAPVWSTEEVGSIPTGYTNAPVDKLEKSSLSKGEI